MKRWNRVAVTSTLVVSSLLLVVALPAEGLLIDGYFSDDNGSLFENDIDAIAQAGITKGCNPPTNNLYCPGDPVQRGPMAAFLRRALNLPTTSTDYFDDDNASIFQADINAIAEAGITKGCNPPTNNLYCLNSVVDRGAMAAFLRRALNLPPVTLQIPLSDHGAIVCAKDGERCTLTVDIISGRTYRVEEGIFQVVPAASEEMSEFEGSSTHFTLTLNGSNKGVTELATVTQGGVSLRKWRADMTFSPGNHTLVGRWRWDGDLIQTAVITVRAGS